MKKLIKRISAFILVLSILLSLTVISTSAASTSQPTVYDSEYNSGTRDVVCTTLSGTSASSYYTGSYAYDKLDDLSSSALLLELRELMTDTHNHTSNYDDCHYEADRTDCENGNKKITLIYTSYQATMSQWNGWNREHVWPQSLGGGNTTGGGADLHHIRPSDAGVNSSRGNKKYGDSHNGTAKYGSDPAVGVLGGYYSSSYFEPLDNVKGDVARICLYVWVRWGSNWGAESVTEVFQSVDLLLEWCALDPVDTWEMGRNEVIQDIQGNRNVFIDYPELAWLVLGREVPDDIVTPSGSAQSGGSTGDDTPACQHSSTELRGFIAATCTSMGYSGDTYCKSCGVKISSGNTTPKAGHSEGDWIIDKNPTYSETGSKHKVCTVCGKTTTTATIPVLVCNHNETESVGKTDPSCSSTGYTGDTYCTVCGDMLESGEVVSKTPHTESEWITDKAATETETGSRYKECTVCGEVLATETIPALGDGGDEPPTEECKHESTELRGYSEPTCKAEGYSGDTYCVDCGIKTVSGNALAQLAHTESDWVVDKEATETEEGERHKVCTVCGEVTVTETIPTLECEHESTELRGVKAASCTALGYSGDKYCTVCGELVEEGADIPKTSHTGGEWIVDKAPTAAEAGSRHKECTVCGETVATEVIPAFTGTDAFAAALALVKSSETVAQKYANIALALNAYNALSADDRAAVSAGYEELSSIIGNYNDAAEDANTDHNEAAGWVIFIRPAADIAMAYAYVPSKKYW